MTTDTEEEKSSKVNDYLSGPKKKKKNYSLFAFGRNFDKDFLLGMENYIKTSYGQLTVTKPKNTQELIKFFNRQVAVLVIDDEFAGISENIQAIRSLKEKKRDIPLPVLFLTEDPNSLIKIYNQELLPYQEMDNYVTYRSMSLPQILARVNNAIETKQKRKSRRYQVDIPLQYFDLARGGMEGGKLLDLSLHGGVLANNAKRVFQNKEQFLLHMPIHKFLPPQHGEFLKLSAKIRRVFMGGDRAAVSWEYVTEQQIFLLTQVVIGVVNGDMRRVNSG